MGVFKAVKTAWLGEKKNGNLEANERALVGDDDTDDALRPGQRRSLDSQRGSETWKKGAHGGSVRRTSMELGRFPPAKAEETAPSELAARRKLWVCFNYGRPTRVELTENDNDVDDMKKRLMVLYPRHLGHLEAFEFGLKMLPHSTEVIPEDTPLEFLGQGNCAAAPIYVDVPANNRGQPSSRSSSPHKSPMPRSSSPHSSRPPSQSSGPHPLPLSPVFSPEKDDNHRRRYSLNSGSVRSSPRDSFGEDSVDDPARNAGSTERHPTSSFQFDPNISTSPNRSPTMLFGPTALFGSTVAVPPRGNTSRQSFQPMRDTLAGAGEKLAKKSHNKWQKGGSSVPPAFTLSPPRPPASTSSGSSGSGALSIDRDSKLPSIPVPTSGVIFTHSLTPDEIMKLLEGLDNSKEGKGLRTLPLPPRSSPASQTHMLSIGKDTERRGSSLDLPRPSIRPQVGGDEATVRRHGSLDIPRPSYLASIAEKSEAKEKWSFFGRRKTISASNSVSDTEGKERRRKLSLSMLRNLWFKRHLEEPQHDHRDASGPPTPVSNGSSDSAEDLPSVASWAVRRDSSLNSAKKNADITV